MEIHEQLKRQLKEYKWKDYTKVSVEIAPEYDDFFEKAGDDYIKSIDMIRFATDTVYSKTHFACLDNELDYDEQHYENIKRIDDFVNKKGIIDVLLSLSERTHVSILFFFIKSTMAITPPFPLRAIRPSFNTTPFVRLFLVPIFKLSNTNTLQSPW